MIPFVFSLESSGNRGGLFGMFQGSAPVLALFSLIAMAFILYYLHRAPANEAWTPVALGLIAAGAIGNFIDRIFNGGVVRDFILLHAGPYKWPTFNIADALICAGVGMVLYAAIVEERAKRKPSAHHAR